MSDAGGLAEVEGFITDDERVGGVGVVDLAQDDGQVGLGYFFQAVRI